MLDLIAVGLPVAQVDAICTLARTFRDQGSVAWGARWSRVSEPVAVMFRLPRRPGEFHGPAGLASCSSGCWTAG
jgi:hypothetical protein